MFKKRTTILILLSVVLLAFTAIFICNKIIIEQSKGKLFTDTEVVPYNRVGLLLGTSKTGREGYNNPYYDYRIEAAAKLIKVGKIKYLIISDDNGRDSYNEPALMRRDLIPLGIDSAIIYLDYAGFRTFDSMVRLKEIFGQDFVTVISQQFHNERATYTAGKLGISAIGFNATDISGRLGLRVQVRERLARVKTFWISG